MGLIYTLGVNMNNSGGSSGADIEIRAVDLAAQDRILADPERMDKIFKHLSAGGTIIDYCRLVGQSYSELMLWVQSDPARVEKYEAGKRARQDWLFESVLAEYKAVSFLDIRTLYDKNNALKPMDQWPDDSAKAVVGVESMEVSENVDGERVPVGEIKKIKTVSKEKTLEALGKYLRMFADVLEVRGEVSIRGALDEAEMRLGRARPVQSADSEIVVEHGGVVDGGSSSKQEPI